MKTLRLIAAGDISLQTRDGKRPFDKVGEIFKKKDILFGNLETVLSNRGKKAEKAVVLCSPPEKVSYLEDAGFDVLNIANNHIMDLGVQGFHNTLDMLRRERLTFIGASDKPEESYVILKKQGIRVGFLGYVEGGFDLPENNVWINKLEPANIIRDIELIKEQCDFVIVSLHWGTENAFYPSPKQVNLAHRLIDAGAAIILGHHSHVVQGIERYKYGLAAYSLGNFQFNPEFPYSDYSMLLCVEFSGQRLKNYHIVPVVIDGDFIPRISNEGNGEILSFMRSVSEPINNNKLTWGWWFEEISEKYLSGNMKSWIIRIRKYGPKHLLPYVLWLISPFVIRCYIGFLAKRLKRR